jgi:hypothetical protein
MFGDEEDSGEGALEQYNRYKTITLVQYFAATNVAKIRFIQRFSYIPIDVWL